MYGGVEIFLQDNLPAVSEELGESLGPHWGVRSNGFGYKFHLALEPASEPWQDMYYLMGGFFE